jgi:hypothetical protein
MNKNNIIICSKNRESNELSASKISVILNNELSCSDNEYFTVNILSLNMIKSFYAIQHTLNNVFYIILKKAGEDDSSYFRSISPGNYNVDSILSHLKIVCFELIGIEYDSIVNKFIFKQENNESTNGYDVYIKPINSGAILGLIDNVEFKINFEGIESETFVNISGYTSLLLKISGISIDNSYINLTTSNYSVSQIIGLFDVAGIIPMDSVTILNNNNNDNQYIINNKKINSFTLEIVNENNVPFPQMSDYILHLCFEKHVRKNEISLLLNTILTKLNDLLFYIVYFFQKSGIIPEN